MIDALHTALALLADGGVAANPTAGSDGGPQPSTDVFFEVVVWVAFAAFALAFVIYAVKRLRTRPIHDTTAAEAAFEAAVLGRLMIGEVGADPAAAQVGAWDDDDAEAEADAAPGHIGDDDIDDELAPQPTGPGGAPALAPIQQVLARLRALKPDLTEIGAVAAVSPGGGRGLAVAWNKRRETAVVFATMPHASDLPGLIKRFDLVIVAPAGGTAEPFIIDRLGAYFMRGVTMSSVKG